MLVKCGAAWDRSQVPHVWYGAWPGYVERFQKVEKRINETKAFLAGNEFTIAAPGLAFSTRDLDLFGLYLPCFVEVCRLWRLLNF